MIRGFFRLIGLLLLAGGFIFMVYDGARFVADQTLRFTRFGQFWNDIHQSSQQAFQAWVEHTAPWLWTSVVKVVLEQPVFAVMSGNAVLAASCSVVRRNGALAVDVKTYIMLEAACSHQSGKRALLAGR